MTPTRWAIVAFWALMILFTGYYLIEYTLKPAPAPVPEKHWFPPPLPNSGPPAISDKADVHLTHYILQTTPGLSQFSVELIAENRGSRKATAVQIQIHPYVANHDVSPRIHGPDEIPSLQEGDPVGDQVQWVSFPDIGPGQTATQTVTLPMRGDADANQRDDRAQVLFQTANP